MIRVGNAEFPERPPADPLELFDLDDDGGGWCGVRWPRGFGLFVLFAVSSAAILLAGWWFG